MFVHVKAQRPIQITVLYAFAIKVAVMYLRQVVIIVIVSTHNGNMGFALSSMASAATSLQ